VLYYAVSLIGEFVDFFIAGRLFGEDGIQVIEVVNPLYAFVCGFAIMLSSGFAALYSHAQGEFNEERCRHIFSQSIVTAAATGAAVCLFLQFFLKSYLRLNGCSGDFFTTCFRYGRIFVLISLVYPAIYLVNSLIEADGCGAFLATQSGVNIAVHIASSWFFAKKYGVCGLAIGLVVSLTLTLLYSCVHFLRKKCSVHSLSFTFSVKDLKDTCKYGSSGFSNYLMVTAVDVILNRFIIKNFGEAYLAPYAIVNLVLDMAIIFESCSYAAVPFLGVYFGEKNHRGVTLLMKILLNCSLVAGVLFTVVFTAGAKWVPLFYGIHSPGTYEASVFASAAVGVFGLFISLNYILITGFPYIDRTGTGLLSGALHSGALPLLLGLTLGSLKGFRGMVMGIALVPVFTVVIISAVLLLREGKKGFPLYLPESDEEQHIFSFLFDAEGREYVCGAIENCLRESGADEKRSAEIRLLLEEMIVRVTEMNDGRTVNGECSLMLSAENARICLRDDGIPNDLTDDNAPASSLNSYVLACLMSRSPLRENLPAASINRNSVSIPLR